MKRGYGRCTRCGCYCNAEYDSGEIYMEGPSGKQTKYQAFPGEWLSDCCGATAEVWEEDR